MSSHARSNGSDGDPLALLAAYRLPIYLGGLAAIGTPLALAEVTGIVVPPAARTAVVVVSLVVMVATYAGERRDRARSAAGDGEPSATRGDRTSPNPEYSLRARLAVAAAVVGVAVGVYVAAAGDLVVGLLFVFGAYLFGYVAYRGEGS